MTRDSLRSCVLALVLATTGALSTVSRAVDVGQLVELRETTQAMRGAKTPVKIAEGARFEVRDAKNGWLLGQFEVEGQKVLGWVRETHVQSTDQSMTLEDDRAHDFAEQLAQRKAEIESLGTAVAFAVSNDSSTLALVTRSTPSRINVIDLATGDTTLRIDVPAGESVRKLQLSDDMKRLAALTEKHIIVWEIEDEPRLIFRGDRHDSPGIPGVTVLLRGDRTAVIGHGQADEITIWNDSGAVLASFETHHAEPIRSFFGPTGRSLVVIYGEGAQCWEEGQQSKFVTGDSILDAAIVANGHYTAIRTQEGIMVWQLEPLQVSDRLRAANIVGLRVADLQPLMFTPRNPGGQIEVSRIENDGSIFHVNTLNAFWDVPIATSPTGETVAYVSKNEDRRWTVLVTSILDGTWHVLRLFRLSDNQGIEKPVDVQLSDNATVVATRSAIGQVAVWDVKSGHVMWHTSIADLDQMWLHPLGNTLLVRKTTGELLLCRPREWSVAASRLTFGSEADGWRRKYIDLKQLHFSRDGQQLVAVTSAKKAAVSMYSTQSGRLRHANGFKANRVEFTANGQQLYMIGKSGAGFCDPLTGRVENVSRYQLGATWQPGERAISGTITINRNTSKVFYDPVTGLAISRYEPTTVQTSGLNVTSPNGAIIAFIGRCLHRNGYGLEVFDVATGRSIAAFPVEINSYVGMDFSPDTRYVLIATTDGVVQIDYRKREVTKLLSMEYEQSLSLPRGGGVAAAALLGAATELGFSGTETYVVDPIRSMDVTANGWIFTGHVSGTVTVWDQATGERALQIANPPDAIDVLSVSEDGRWMACGPEDGGAAYLLDLRRRLPQRDELPATEGSDVNAPTELTLSF